MSDNIDLLQSQAMVEIRSTVKRTGRPKLVPYSNKYNYVGFASVYGYTQSAIDYIDSTGSTKGLAKFPVYSNVLYVDFDDNEEAATKFAGFLNDNNYMHEVFHSGGRSVHFHVPINDMYGINVPYSQKYWMEQHAPEADMSIYRHSGIYRLPGTYHTKYPGKQKKRLNGNYNGKLLNIENRPKVLIPISDKDNIGNGEEYFHMILGKLLNTKISEGGRHPHAYKIAMACKSSGKDELYARRLLGMWNNDNCYPSKREWELDKLINWVYYHA